MFMVSIEIFTNLFCFIFQITVDSVEAKQMEKEIEVRGPPVSKAFDDQGNPTKVSLILYFHLGM